MNDQNKSMNNPTKHGKDERNQANTGAMGGHPVGTGTVSGGNDQNKSMNNPTKHGKDERSHANTGAMGGHPVGTGLGAIGAGAVAGTIGGAVAGPVGAVAGAAIGAVAGAVAGKVTAEAINPSVETTYWLEHHASRPYATPDVGYEEYAPAYRYGWESFDRDSDQSKTFDSIEADLARGWNQAKGSSSLAWDKAKTATRDAWDRVKLATVGPAHA